MSFSNPEAFFLLFILVPFTLVVIYNYGEKKKILNGFISENAYKRLGYRSGKEVDFFKASLIILSLIFFITALAGPEWGEKYEHIDMKGIELVFLMDTSNSMNAEDLKPNRLEIAKNLIISIVDNLKTDFVSLINFAGVAYVQCPLTVDYEAFKLMTEASLISPDEEQGTDFSVALNLALNAFKKSKGTTKVVVLITDGEDQEHEWHEIISEFKKQGIVIFTVGVGVISGAPIPLKDKDEKVIGWKKDKKGNIVKTKLDEKPLIRIASQTGGQYFRLTSVSSIDVFVKSLKQFERSVIQKKVKLKKIKRFIYPLSIGIIFLILELLLTEKKIKWVKKQF